MLARPLKGFFRIARVRVSRLNNQSLYHNRDTLIFAKCAICHLNLPDKGGGVNDDQIGDSILWIIDGLFVRFDLRSIALLESASVPDPPPHFAPRALELA